MSDKPKYWAGPAPSHCDLCQKPIKDVFVDGRTSMSAWANMCLHCFGEYGTGLGQGRGQLYADGPDREWMKMEG